MLKSIAIENFKAFGEKKTIEFSNLNILAGLNSSGKSSVYQIILLAAQSSESGGNAIPPSLILNGKYINLGIPKDVLHDPNKKSISFDLHWDSGLVSQLTFGVVGSSANSEDESGDFFELIQIREGHPAKDPKDLEVFYSLSRSNDRATWFIEAQNCITSSTFLESFGYFKNEHITNPHLKETPLKDFFQDVVKTKITDTIFSGFSLFLFEVDLNGIKDFFKRDIISDELLEKYIEYVKKEKGDKHHFQFQTGYQFPIIYSYFLNAFAYLKPFRGFPQRIYEITDPSANWVSKYYTKKLTQNLNYKFDFENNEPISANLETAFNYWCVEHFDLCRKIEVVSISSGFAYEIIVELHNGKKVPLNQIGFGVSQILPIVHEVLSSSSPCIVIDEPEVHLHPKLQNKLADFFFQMALIGNKKVFIETHSEYFLESLVYLDVLHEKRNTDKIKMYWIEKCCTTGDADARLIETDELGYISNYPQGFLEARQLTSDLFNDLRVKKI